jgi:aromatic-L-amino-acid/L-tryptophan decarboxylase
MTGWGWAVDTEPRSPGGGSTAPKGDALALDADTMRALGHRTVDMLVDRLTDDRITPLTRASPSEMARRLHAPAPREPQPFDEILRRLEEDVLAFTSRVGHPAFLAFVPSAGTWPSALADFVASACNIYAGSWMESAGPSQVELEVLGWFKEWIGYPESAAGSLLTGGSAANMTALACAREHLAGPMSDRLMVYVSDQSHSSLARAARVLGFRPDQVRVVATDRSLRFRPQALGAAIDADVRAGRRPLFVSVSGGATNAGTIDPLPELAELCRDRGVWMHADAAYGGFAVLTERGRRQLEGLALADSIAIDPHKWLYQPYECGCLLVRDGRALRQAFEITPDYLSDAAASQAEVNFADLGMQLTRAARAVKVWVSVRYFGLDAFRRAIDRALDLASFAAQRADRSDTLELIAAPTLGIVCLRRRFDDETDEDELERRNAALIAELEASGLGLVSSTRLHGVFAIRLCVLNHSTSEADLERVLAFLESHEVGREAAPAPPVHERDTDVSGSWVSPELGGDEALALVSLFHGLSPDELRRVLEAGRIRTAVSGEAIVSQWDASTELYVILEGTADVEIDGRRRGVIEAGRFFGELAAVDWGAGYRYSRTATVRANSPMRLLVIEADDLRGLLRDLPVIESRVRAASRRHLQWV